MSLSIFIAILCAALLHASWNALVKNSRDKIQGMLVLTLTHGFLGVVIACFVEIPKIDNFMKHTKVDHACNGSFVYLDQ